MSDADLAALARYPDRALPELLGDMRRLVELETPSNDKTLLDTGLTAIGSWLRERLGEPDEYRHHDGGAHGDVAELTYSGTRPGTVLLLCHYDTVWPAGTLQTWPVTVDGDRVSGPGCFDMKAGIVQGVWALRALRELGLPHPSVRLLLTGDEEVGSPQSRAHIERASADVVATLVLEPSEDGKLKIGRKGLGLFDIVAQGIESHAGLAPEAGASAVHALAEIIPELTTLADAERGTTVNVGIINGGTGRNVVAGHASCQVDIRIQDPAEMRRLDDAFARLAPSDPRITLSAHGEWNRPPMNPNPSTEQLLSTARGVAARLALPLNVTTVGGASDANFVSALNRPVLDGLGAVGDGAHARDEHVLLSRAPKQIALVAGLLLTTGES